MKMWGITNTGLVRSENQDAYAVFETGVFHGAVVCDGMGGTSGGQVASAIAVSRFEKELRALGAKHIELRPMMLVAGDHAQNDMTGGEDDSWKSRLTAAGFDVHCTLEGLGELEDVQRLYVEHLKAELK